MSISSSPENTQKEKIEELVDNKIDKSFEEYNGAPKIGEIKKIVKFETGTD